MNLRQCIQSIVAKHSSSYGLRSKNVLKSDLSTVLDLSILKRRLLHSFTQSLFFTRIVYEYYMYFMF